MKITCMDGRIFLKEKTFRTHVERVHSDAAVLFAKFEVAGEPDVFGAPYNVPVAGDDVAHEKGACTDCLANGHPGRLPVHPDCSCEPSGGWPSYIKSLEQPKDVADDMWKSYVSYLKKAT